MVPLCVMTGRSSLNFRRLRILVCARPSTPQNNLEQKAVDARDIWAKTALRAFGPGMTTKEIS
jgi:hypothetical protein